MDISACNKKSYDKLSFVRKNKRRRGGGQSGRRIGDWMEGVRKVHVHFL